MGVGGAQCPPICLGLRLVAGRLLRQGLRMGELTWLGHSQELRNGTVGYLAITECTHHQYCIIGPCAGE